MKHDARLDLRLSTEMRDRVKAAAKGSVNEWVREAIQFRLLDEKISKQALPRVELAKLVPRAINPPEEIPLPKIAPRKWGS